jgi:hypothetical protein
VAVFWVLWRAEKRKKEGELVLGVVSWCTI